MGLNAWFSQWRNEQGWRTGDGGIDELGRFYLFSSHEVENGNHIALLEAIYMLCADLVLFQFNLKIILHHPQHESG